MAVLWWLKYELWGDLFNQTNEAFVSQRIRCFKPFKRRVTMMRAVGYMAACILHRGNV